MNLHPIFVHFPVAFLIIYSLMELIRFKKITNQVYWFYTKAILVSLGGLGLLAAYFTGSSAKAAIQAGELSPHTSNYNQVVQMHETFAKLSVIIFGIIAACYVIMWFNQKIKISGIFQVIVNIAKFFIDTPFVILFALAGLICITIVGGLGGVIVYGPSADPYFGIVYKLLFQ